MANESGRVKRGQKAKEVLNDPLFVDSFNDIQNEQIAKFLKSQVTEPEKREEAYWTLKGMELFKAELHRKIMDGVKAKQQLDKLNGGA